MKKLILDYSKWRCGWDGEYKLGEGDTALCNFEGFECCLGQFTLQLTEGIDPDDLIKHGDPSELGFEVPYLNFVDEGEQSGFSNTKLSDAAMSINDNSYTTPERKIEQLKELFATAGFEIEVTNKP